ncbi:MAG: hypothetical protein HC905_12830 [Bacteroidales bacterium]|nr:hypothetical protein [Bacteroidales bacterium]
MYFKYELGYNYCWYGNVPHKLLLLLVYENIYSPFAASLLSLSSFCQTIQVNPDGSHSVIHTTGNISTVVNPDGTHTVIFNNGSTSTQVNPRWFPYEYFP